MLVSPSDDSIWSEAIKKGPAVDGVEAKGDSGG